MYLTLRRAAGESDQASGKGSARKTEKKNYYLLLDR